VLIMVTRASMRRNPVSGAIVIISPDRQKTREQLARKKPRDWSKIKPEIVSGQECPFEIGHEAMTPPEIRAYRENGSKPNSPGWWVRAVPNSFPALDSSIPSEFIEEEVCGPFLSIPAYGQHYVIVESPNHASSLGEMTPKNVREVAHMWRELTLLVGGRENIQHVFVFENYGPLSGASQPHPHSQLMGLPMVPTRILNELRGSGAYYDKNKICFYCQEIEWEMHVRERIVAENNNFLAWCPYTSRVPYQVMISPKKHQSFFANICTYPPGQDPLTEFSQLLQEILLRLKICLDDPDYNLYFHTAPSSRPDILSYHWHCQIEPRTESTPAGFESGAGVYVNTRSPENAAGDLKDIKIENK